MDGEEDVRIEGGGGEDGEYEWLYVNDEEATYVEHVQSLLPKNTSLNTAAYILL